MMRHKRLEHRFVEDIPESLDPGVLYVSMEYATAAHSCCCGCGEEVVTPFTPTDWKMTFDGETISLKPSVGSWTLACRSHYVIDRGKVIEAAPWTSEQIDSERHRDRAAKARYYRQQEAVSQPHIALTSSQPAAPPSADGLWQRLWHFITGAR
jgi:hypothetical protein